SQRWPFRAVDLIGNCNHGSLGRHLVRFERKCGLATATNIDRFAGSRADTVHSHDHRTVGQSPHEQKLSRFEFLILGRANGPADYLSQVHKLNLRYLIDDADDRRIYRRILAALRHSRRTSLYDENFFPKPGVYGVHGDDVALFIFSIRIDKPANQELLSFKPRILPSSHDA